MTDIVHPAQITQPPGLSLRQWMLIAVIGFLTLVDLFATQAILPSLSQIYGVAPAKIGLAANASTLGMAISGLLMGVVSGALERKKTIALSLFFLSFPTALLAFAPSLTVFAILRVTQGVFMAAPFAAHSFNLQQTFLRARSKVENPCTRDAENLVHEMSPRCIALETRHGRCRPLAHGHAEFGISG